MDFADVSSDIWEPLIDLNIKAGLYMIKYFSHYCLPFPHNMEDVILCSEFLPDMRRRRKGHVVNITSVMERDAVKGFAVYAGTKHFWTGEYEDKGVMMKYF